MYGIWDDARTVDVGTELELFCFPQSWITEASASGIRLFRADGIFNGT
jgi:hypothetical protein